MPKFQGWLNLPLSSIPHMPDLYQQQTFNFKVMVAVILDHYRRSRVHYKILLITYYWQYTISFRQIKFHILVKQVMCPRRNSGYTQ